MALTTNVFSGRGASRVDTKKEQRRDIQGLRAIAVTAVVLFHAGLPLPGGFAGVDVFFVISGYVITAMLQREWDRAGAISLSRFYFRRFKRLMPALSLLISVVIVLSALLLSPLGSVATVTALTGIGAMLMASNVVIATKTGGYFGVAAEGNPLLNMWSLSVEEQFYLIFPVVLVLVFWVSRRTRSGGPLVAVLLLAIASFSLAMWGEGLKSGFYSPIARAWEFAAGAVLALMAMRAPPPRIATFLAAVGMALVGASFFLVTKNTPFPGPMTLLPVLGSMALIHAGGESGLVARTLSSAPMVYLGDISYSWYLWHWPFIVFASVVVGPENLVLVAAALLSLFPAIASYRWVEGPLRRLEPMSRLHSARFIALTLVPPLLICVLLIFASSNGFWSEKIRSHQSAIDTVHAGNAADCGQGFVPSSPDDPTCTWNSEAIEAPIYLVGDSNADHFSEPVISVGEQLNRPVKIFTKGGCAFLGRSWSDRNDAEQTKCLAFVDGSLSLLDHSTPGVVVLGLSDSIWRSPGSAVGLSRESESSDPSSTRPYLQSELTSTVRRIQLAGHRVIMLQPIAKFVAPDNALLFDPSRCTTIAVLLSDCPKKISVTTKNMDEIQRDARTAIAKTAGETGSELIDFREHMCPDGRCSNYGPGGLTYRDAGHLNVEGSAALVDVFRRAIDHAD